MFACELHAQLLKGAVNALLSAGFVQGDVQEQSMFVSDDKLTLHGLASQS